MENLYAEHNHFLNILNSSFSREVQQEIGWEERLLFIKGARGIGKTTIILQHIKETFEADSRKVLYISMDSLAMAGLSIIEVAKNHMNLGGTHLFVDEIHKYDNWSLELKNIYDKYRKLNVVVSGSSILDLYKGNADLSRRGVTHVIHGLTLREFINIEANVNLPTFTLPELLKSHVKKSINLGVYII